MHIYLDNSASTPLSSSAAEAIYDCARNLAGNPSSLHRPGQKLKGLLEDTRHLLAQQLGCDSGEITFTSGGTESNNLALYGVARAHASTGRHLLVSPIEHPSVIESAKRLQGDGFEVEWLPVDEHGRVAPQAVASRLRPNTILVSVMWVNNETGIIQPVEEIADICHTNGTIFHCDAVQAFGKLPLALDKIAIDLLTISAHKIYGPSGVGALFIRRGTPIDALLTGGSQEARRRAGTENILGICGFKAALEELTASLKHNKHMRSLQKRFEAELLDRLPESVLIGGEGPRSPYISLIAFPGLAQDTLLMALDMAGIAASAGSACSSGSLRPSHVLQAMHLKEELVSSAIRFSFGRFTTEAEVSAAVERIAEVHQRLRR